MGLHREVLMGILKELEHKGFRVAYKGHVEGESGAKHYFDLIIEHRETGEKLAITILERVTPEDVLSFQLAKIDTCIPHLIVAKHVNSIAQEILEKLEKVVMKKVGENTMILIEPRNTSTSPIGLVNGFLEVINKVRL